MTAYEVSVIMREATQKIIEQRAWIQDALPYLEIAAKSVDDLDLFIVKALIEKAPK